MEFLIIFAIFAVGFLVGWIMREELAKRRIDALMDTLEDAIEQATEESLVKIKIEQHSGAYYVFNSETDEFMAQALNRKDLEDELAKKYPDKNFMATPENLAQVGFK
jgi:glutamate-1-semialdehyde aminotransferase